MILFVVYYLPDGIVGFLRDVAGPPRWRRAHVDAIRATPTRAERRRPSRPRAGASRRGRCSRSNSVVMQFGGLTALDRVDLAVMPRHDPRPDRPQRLGQEHDDERAHRHLHAHRRARFASRASRYRRPASRREIAARGHRAHLPERAAVRRTDAASRTSWSGLHHTYRAAPGRRRAAHCRARAREEAGARGARRRSSRFVGLEPARQRGGAQPALRQAAPAGDRPRAGAGPEAAAARRAGGRPDRARHRGTDRDHPQDPRRTASP